MPCCLLVLVLYDRYDGVMSKEGYGIYSMLLRERSSYGYGLGAEGGGNTCSYGKKNGNCVDMLCISLHHHPTSGGSGVHKLQLAFPSSPISC